MIYRNKNTGWYYLLDESDNYGYDCYIFNEKKEAEDGYVPFAYDCLPYDEPERSRELELIRKWDKEMSEQDRIEFCLKEMKTSIGECELINNEELEDELWENC